MATRKGLGKGKGQGYKNIIPKDKSVHSMSARGMKQPVKAIPKIDINRYMGKWYQVSAFPAWFQRGCSNAIAEYQKKDGYISVKNSCVRADGRPDFRVAKAYPLNSGKSKLEVDFFGGLIKGDYWVLYVDRGYNHAVVGTPDRKYLWLLSRDKKPSMSKLEIMKYVAKREGFDISKLR